MIVPLGGCDCSQTQGVMQHHVLFGGGSAVSVPDPRACDVLAAVHWTFSWCVLAADCGDAGMLEQMQAASCGVHVRQNDGDVSKGYGEVHTCMRSVTAQHAAAPS
jgi:hypothetical protein